MTLEVKRLHLASLQGVDGGRWPVHGFVVPHPGGAVLVDTGRTDRGRGAEVPAVRNYHLAERTIAAASSMPRRARASARSLPGSPA
jgi:hypothetical protein